MSTGERRHGRSSSGSAERAIGKADRMRRGRWKDTIQHDGYFVVRLRLFTVDEGGQNRHVQSGIKGRWTTSEGRGPAPGVAGAPRPIGEEHRTGRRGDHPRPTARTLVLASCAGGDADRVLQELAEGAR